MSNPHADTELAIYLTRRVLELQPKKSQAEIATEAGYVNPNMISMLKAGSTKLPIDRVPDLARALDCDPAYLLRLALDQNIGSTATKAIYDIVGKPVTENEHGWLEVLREASDNSDPRITARRKNLIFATFGKA